MAELTVTKFGAVVAVSLDDDGRPYCFCGCGQLLTEVSPGAFRCPDGLALEAGIQKLLGPVLAAHERGPG